MIAKGSNTRYFLDNFTSCNDVILNPNMELASYTLVQKFTEMGFGIGYLTKDFIMDELNNGDLFEVNVEPKTPNREIGMIHPNNKFLSKSATKFIEILKKGN